MKKIILAFLFKFCILNAEDLSIDSQFADSKQLELSVGFDYVNSYSNGLYYNTTVIETLNGDYILVPTNNYYTTSSDYIGLNISTNYGFNEQFSIYSYLSYYYIFSRDIDLPQNKTKKYKQFDSFNVGISYLIKEETKTPSLYIKLSTSLIDKIDINKTKVNKNFTSANITIGTYFSTDPITFMFQSTYIYNKVLEHENYKLKHGDIFIFSPTMYFSINPYVTINFDLEYQYINKSKENNKYITHERSKLTKGFGVIYEISQYTSFSLDYSYNNNGSSSDSVSMYLTYKL